MTQQPTSVEEALAVLDGDDLVAARQRISLRSEFNEHAAILKGLMPDECRAYASKLFVIQ